MAKLRCWFTIFNGKNELYNHFDSDDMHIDDFSNGFWVDADGKLCDCSNNRYYIPPSQILCIEIFVDEPPQTIFPTEIYAKPPTHIHMDHKKAKALIKLLKQLEKEKFLIDAVEAQEIIELYKELIDKFGQEQH